MTWVSARTPGMETQTVLHSRGAPAPWMAASGAIARSATSNRSRKPSMTRPVRASTAAAPKPTIPGYVFRTGAPIGLLAAAPPVAREGYAAAHGQGADARRSTQLVG